MSVTTFDSALAGHDHTAKDETGRVVQPHATSGARSRAEKLRALAGLNPRLAFDLFRTRFWGPRDHQVVEAFMAYRQGRDFEFSYDFVSNNLPYAAPLIRAFDQAHGSEPIRYLEIGAYEGLNLAFMDWLLPGRIEATVIDPWFDERINPDETYHEVQERFHRNVARMGFRAMDARRGFSSDLLPVLRQEGQRFDMVYIDGSHTALDVMVDMCCCTGLLRTGGMMILDDYWHDVSDISGPGVKQAVDRFLDIFHPYFRVEAAYRQVVLTKTAAVPG